MIYQKNRTKAQFKNTEPTMTDQSMARETDINVIVGRFMKTGLPPVTLGRQPIFADFTGLPHDLRAAIEMARSIDGLRHQLPKELRDMPIEELVTLTQDQLTNILTPPAKEEPAKQEPAPEPAKEGNK